ncbi:MAG: asparaginase [Burkholderiaceae bacterium]|nr:asparaginase [Burkholderiaceae bacterium]
MNPKKIVILTTGGTIVSSGTSSTQLTGYSITDFKVNDLLSQIPELSQFADISIEAVSNIDSSNMTSEIWVRLAQRITTLASYPEIDGFVITHGTDTMEETAFFLSLTVQTSKPIVLTGAMRPATAISADGPINLLNAVRVAVHPEAQDKGPVIVMNDKIFSARDATKSDPTNADTFVSTEFGSLGLISGNRIVFYRNTPYRHTVNSEFQIPQLPLPRVDVVLSHVDADHVFIEASVASGAKGIVHMGTGNGSIHSNSEQALIKATLAGLIIVRGSRTWKGCVVEGLEHWQDAGFIPQGTLSAIKSRILLQVALAHGLDKKNIARVFTEY